MAFPKQKSCDLVDFSIELLQQQQKMIHRNQHRHSQSQQRRNSSTFSPLNGRSLAMVLLPLVFLTYMVSPTEALTCYETVNGKTTIKQNDTWLYCSLVPATMVRDDKINGTRFGLGPDNDGVEAYKAAFGMNESQYRVLTVCIYERYDFSRFLGLKPDTAVEFAFRCVCNYDLCNSEGTFYPFLKTLNEESYVVKN
uniref:Uncharacterized protein n=1 Tax=Ditylenchus dipsaci TaxID=166011 RepID=A0A915ETR3_9BILA